MVLPEALTEQARLLTLDIRDEPAILVAAGDDQSMSNAAFFTHQTCYGIETMCIGGGQGLIAVFERAG